MIPFKWPWWKGFRDQHTWCFLLFEEKTIREFPEAREIRVVSYSNLMPVLFLGLWG